MNEIRTYVILLVHVHSSAILSNSKLVLLAHSVDSSVMLLVTNGGSRSQEERTSYYRCNKWKTEQGEWMLCQSRAVFGSDCIGIL